MLAPSHRHGWVTVHRRLTVPHGSQRHSSEHGRFLSMTVGFLASRSCGKAQGGSSQVGCDRRRNAVHAEGSPGNRPYKEGPGVADNVGHSRAVVGRKRDIADGATDWQPGAHGREQNPSVSSRRLRSGPSPRQGPSGRTLPPSKAIIGPCSNRAHVASCKSLHIIVLQQF